MLSYMTASTVKIDLRLIKVYRFNSQETQATSAILLCYVAAIPERIQQDRY